DPFAGDGLLAAHRIGVWEIASQQLVAAAVVVPGTLLNLNNRFRVQTIEPVLLHSGTAYVIAGLATGDAGHNVLPGSSASYDPRITLGAWRSGLSIFGFPTTVVPTTTRFMGPDFVFVDAPSSHGD